MMFKKRYLIFSLCISIAIGTSAFAFFAWQQNSIPLIELSDLFVKRPLHIRNHNLFDIGVVDFNDDKMYDIFSSSHQSRPSLLKGRGNFQFDEVLTEYGLDHQPSFPGIEISADAVLTDLPGLYIHLLVNTIRIVWIPVNSSSQQQVSGQFTLVSPIKVNQNRGFEVKIQSVYQDPDIEKNVVLFNAKNRAEITFEAMFIDIPIVFEIDSRLSSKFIKIGAHHQILAKNDSPSLLAEHRFKLFSDKYRFKLFLNDRHGLAWADINKDRKTDLFISRGGLRNKMSFITNRFDENFLDELFLQDSAGFNNVTAEFGILKNNCPGYNTAWIDYDQDNFLDLYITCHHNNPNMLYRNLGNSYFRNTAEEIGLDLKGSLTDTPFAWLDTDNDGDLDLIIATDDGIVHYVQVDRSFRKYKTYQIFGVNKIAINDFDNDGDLDLLLSSYLGYTCILESQEATFALIKADIINIPATCLFGNWVDFDNDGRTDLYIAPYGLFRQNSNKTFIKTGILEHRQPKFIKRLRSTWCDFDNDGDLDLLVAAYYENSLWKSLIKLALGQYTPKIVNLRGPYGLWDVNIYENLSDKRLKNNWLQFILKDFQTNTDAIGSTVKIEYDDKQHKLLVGQAEGSLTSQGHYRLYLGLGKSEHISSLVINWPDNQNQTFEVDNLNQIYEIHR